MDGFGIGLLSGLISGVVSSLLFLLFLSWFFRPKISISPWIARGHDRKGAPVWRIKVVNRSNSDAVNVRAELHELHEISHQDKEMQNITTKLPLVRDSLYLLEGFNPNTRSDYSFVFVHLTT